MSSSNLAVPEYAVTVVTGAGSGIGRATAARFARKGSMVIVADINEHTGAQTVAMIEDEGGRAVFRRLDVADVEDWEAFTGWVCQEHGIPDVVVNNAGILITGGFLEQTGADWRRMIAINMMSPLVGSRLFVQRMVDAGRKGHIVNVCSVGAFIPSPFSSSYVTAKAGAWFGTQALRAEFGGQGIGVSAICPGTIGTDLAANGDRAGVDADADAAWRATTGRILQMVGRSPDRAAAAIERAVRWNLSTVPIGIEAWFFWYLSRLSPSAQRGVWGVIRMPLVDWLTVNLGDKFLAVADKVMGGVR